jgi:hypothetical protein
VHLQGDDIASGTAATAVEDAPAGMDSESIGATAAWAWSDEFSALAAQLEMSDDRVETDAAGLLDDVGGQAHDADLPSRSSTNAL